MAGIFSDMVAAARRSAAESALSGLMTWLGSAGAAAAAAIPGLLAELDQHRAAVIDALCVDGRPLGPIGLAGYAAGVQDAAVTDGWQLPAPGADLDWSRAQWPVVRLVAVCSLARESGYA